MLPVTDLWQGFFYILIFLIAIRTFKPAVRFIEKQSSYEPQENIDSQHHRHSGNDLV